MSDSATQPHSRGGRWWVLRDLWRLHPPVALMVRATPAACLQTLMTAARPSQQRLHLRDLFAYGRRYYIQPQTDGFRITSDSRRWGMRRNRTTVAATVNGAFSKLGADADAVTVIRLHARARISYMLTGLLIPAFISSIIIYMPWSRLATGALIALLFGLSWVGYRLNAALQATDLIYFVRKALEDLPRADSQELPAGSPDVVAGATNAAFREAWQRFYREQTGGPPADAPDATEPSAHDQPERTPPG
ncbi:MAG: hypothetical protein GYB67_06010 [Chloroflexi bacterium]|nr:hypothetical protein [Chloroflexota bacterium]